MQHHPLDPTRLFFLPSDPTTIVDEKLAYGPLGLFVLVAEYLSVPARGRDTRVPVGSQSVLLDGLLVLAPPLLHAVVHLHVRHHDHDRHLAIAKHFHEQVVRLLHRDGDASALHAEHEKADPARSLEPRDERVRLVHHVHVLGLFHVALRLVQPGRVVQGKIDPVEGDVVFLRVERAALDAARGSGELPAGDEIDEGALSDADVSDDQDVTLRGSFGGGGTRTDAICPHGRWVYDKTGWAKTSRRTGSKWQDGDINV